MNWHTDTNKWSVKHEVLYKYSWYCFVEYLSNYFEDDCSCKFFPDTICISWRCLGISIDQGFFPIKWSNVHLTHPEMHYYISFTFLACFWYGTLLVRYDTFLTWYGTFFIRYATLLVRYDTFLVRYDTFTIRFPYGFFMIWFYF